MGSWARKKERNTKMRSGRKAFKWARKELNFHGNGGTGTRIDFETD